MVSNLHSLWKHKAWILFLTVIGGFLGWTHHAITFEPHVRGELQITVQLVSDGDMGLMFNSERFAGTVVAWLGSAGFRSRAGFPFQVIHSAQAPLCISLIIPGPDEAEVIKRRDKLMALLRAEMQAFDASGMNIVRLTNPQFALIMVSGKPIQDALFWALMFCCLTGLLCFLLPSLKDASSHPD